MKTAIRALSIVIFSALNGSSYFGESIEISSEEFNRICVNRDLEFDFIMPDEGFISFREFEKAIISKIGTPGTADRRKDPILGYEHREMTFGESGGLRIQYTDNTAGSGIEIRKLEITSSKIPIRIFDKEVQIGSTISEIPKEGLVSKIYQVQYEEMVNDIDEYRVSFIPGKSDIDFVYFVVDPSDLTIRKFVLTRKLI